MTPASQLVIEFAELSPSKLCRRCDTRKPVAEFYRRKKKWTPHCKDCMRVYLQRWYAELTPERREAKRERERGWYGRIAEEERAALRQRDRGRRPASEKSRAYSRARYAARPELSAAAQNRRRARRAAAEGSHTVKEWQAILEIHGGLCAYCRVAPATSRDHRVPLFRGGSDYIENIVPACKTCNGRKAARPVQEFLRDL